MRFLLSLSLLGLGITIVLAGSAGAGTTTPARVSNGGKLRTIRSDVDHYRRLAWTFASVAHEPRKPTSYSYRRSTDPSYLEWTLARWERVAYEERGHALARLRRRTRAALPHAPKLHAVLGARIAFSRRLTLKLKRIYPGRVPHTYVHADARTSPAALQLWQARSAQAAAAVAAHARAATPARQPQRSLLDAGDPLVEDFLCIHRFEGSWSSNTGNGYYGGLQMDLGFQRAYGSDYLARWGTADSWPAAAQIEVALRAYHAGRGFWPWPNSARMCGLI